MAVKLYHLPQKGVSQPLPTTPQIVGMIREMEEDRTPRRGKDICAAAKAKGYVRSKIADDVLFAYYAREFERLGVLCDTQAQTQAQTLSSVTQVALLTQ